MAMRRMTADTVKLDRSAVNNPVIAGKRFDPVNSPEGLGEGGKSPGYGVGGVGEVKGGAMQVIDLSGTVASVVDCVPCAMRVSDSPAIGV